MTRAETDMIFEKLGAIHPAKILAGVSNADLIKVFLENRKDVLNEQMAFKGGLR
jgi:hypothetical protein